MTVKMPRPTTQHRPNNPPPVASFVLLPIGQNNPIAVPLVYLAQAGCYDETKHGVSALRGITSSIMELRSKTTYCDSSYV